MVGAAICLLGTGGWRVSRDRVDIRGSTFTPTRVTGSVGDVWWELGADPGAVRLDPVPLAARYLRPFDLQLVSRPRARFDGTVTVGGESFGLDGAPGTISHYWGRRLPDSWVWVSADGLGAGGGLVEAALIRTRMWGVPGGGVSGGYMMTCGEGGSRQVVAPAYGKISAIGDRTGFELTARAPGRRLRVRAQARAERYNDLGEGIHQTLLGDVQVDGLGALAGGAGLEVRGAPFRAGLPLGLDGSGASGAG